MKLLNIVEATCSLLRKEEYQPFVLNGNYPEGGFETHFNKHLLEELRLQGLDLPNMGTIIPGLNAVISEHYIRRFDLRHQDQNNENWSVVELGHERSNRGYLQGERKPNCQGLWNKLAFDMCKNHFVAEAIDLKMYPFLVFSFEDGVELDRAFELYDFIIRILPAGHDSFTTKMYRNGELVGRILILDYFTMDQFKAFYQDSPELHQFVKPIETANKKKWYKHEYLIGNIDSPILPE